MSTSAPQTSIRMSSFCVVMTPDGVTAFCSAIAFITSSRRTPMAASCSGREGQVDLLFLVAVDLDLAGVRRRQERRLRGLGEVARLPPGVAVEGDAVDDAEDVAILVVEERPDGALRQLVLDIGTFLRTSYQALGYGRGRRRIEELDVDQRLARRRVALDDVDIGRLLELLLDGVGELVHGVDEGGAGPRRRNHHGVDRESSGSSSRPRIA